MRFLIVASIAAQIVVGATSPANAETSASDVLVSCEALVKDVKVKGGRQVSIPQAGLQCTSYMEAIFTTIALAGGSITLPTLRVCIPPEATALQFVRIYIEYARGNPAQLHWDAAHLTWVALSQAFPCR